MRILGNKLLVAPLPPQEKSAGGIVMPAEQVGDLKMWWRVEQVGEGAALPKKPKTKPHGLLASDYRVGEVVITKLQFSHHHLEDGTGRRIVSCDQFEGRLE